MANQLKGTDILKMINVDIHSPVLPNEKSQARIIQAIERNIGKCKVTFYTERGNTFEIGVYNGDNHEKPELQERVMNLFFNFLYQN
jgi:hypothetical protein